jgi:hypothetical protein
MNGECEEDVKISLSGLGWDKNTLLERIALSRIRLGIGRRIVPSPPAHEPPPECAAQYDANDATETESQHSAVQTVSQPIQDGGRAGQTEKADPLHRVG